MASLGPLFWIGTVVFVLTLIAGLVMEILGCSDWSYRYCEVIGNKGLFYGGIGVILGGLLLYLVAVFTSIYCFQNKSYSFDNQRLYANI